ncbi:Exodeoxyribonuclease [Listeria grayi]|uniref:Exodeoxyribonuclease III n=1 Tax=Listeria grayi FSL F6-1183 TaxID=1265827 RepID=A0A829R5H2_LISGR|nr:exodeoxyribonuclease III [Listeria grayi]EUJ26963.1 exodeoxyribonuclease III [Listeria grayi FSL F6-1183]VEI33320.1 Exodeoxyribonuclease [Listeria grayi]
MRFISWNVNGLRAAVKKGFSDYFKEADADIFCVQETKLQAGQIELEGLEGYHDYWNYAVKKGYSGTAVFTKEEPLSVQYGLPEDVHNQEGRVITLEFPAFYFVTVYTPNSQAELKRLDYRTEWEQAFADHIIALDKQKPVVFCGDLNVAHQEIDLKNPKTNRKNPGFSDQERAMFGQLLDNGFVDTFRYLYPEQEDAYSWWSYRMNARSRNVGWRIDYFVVSSRLADSIQEARIHAEVLGSDHCPVELEIAIQE